MDQKFENYILYTVGAGVRALNVRPYVLPPQIYFPAIFSTFLIMSESRFPKSPTDVILILNCSVDPISPRRVDQDARPLNVLGEEGHHFSQQCRNLLKERNEESNNLRLVCNKYKPITL